MIDLAELTINDVHEAYANGKFTCRELVEAYLERIEALDANGPKVNSLLARSLTALDEADALDHLWKTSGKSGALHGIPVIIKDQAETKGITTTYGSIVAKDNVPDEDATVVARLRAAGAIILAKSTLCDFAAGWFSTSSMSGTTRNPYDLDREPGGSSAGTGAAIAANFAVIGLGEDTGGSIRIPSSFCGLVGLRPTVGLVSRKGMSPLLVSQDTAGPMARTVRDAALMLDVIAGFDIEDSYTITAAIAGKPIGNSYAANLTANIIGPSLRIGVLSKVFGDDKDSQCHATNIVARQALEKLGTAGVTLLEVEIPRLDHYLDFTSLYLYRSRYDLDKFLATKPHLKTSVSEIGVEKQFHPALDLWPDIAQAHATPYEYASYSRRLEERDDFQRLVMSIIVSNNLDAIAFPDVRIPAPLTKDVLEGKYTSTGTPTNTVIASLTRLPAISVPVGLTEEKSLPVGLEFMGMPYHEQKLLEIAYGVEQLIQGRRRLPAPF